MLFPVVALAEAASSSPWAELLPVIINGLLIPIILALGAALVKLLPEWLNSAKAKTKINQSEAADKVKNRMLDLIGMVVLETNQTTMKEIKRVRDAGGFTEENYKAELAKVKGEVLSKVKKHATVAGVWDDMKFVVFNDKKAADVVVEEFVSGALEAVVHKAKPTATAAKPVAPAANP